MRGAVGWSMLLAMVPKPASPPAASLAAALELLTESLPYVRGLEAGAFEPWCRAVGPAAAARTVGLGHALIDAWLTRLEADLDHLGDDPLAWAIGAIARVRIDLADLFDVPLQGLPLPDPRARQLAALAAPRLLRGICNCDVMNHLFGLLLTRWGEVELVTVHSGHRLVRMRSFASVAGPVFVDAYTRMPPFVLRSGADLPSRSQAAEIAETHRRARVAAGLRPGEAPLSAWEYRFSRRLHRLERPRGEPLPPLVDPPARAPEGPRTEDEPERRYYLARAEQLFGDREAAQREYRAIADSRTRDHHPVWVDAADHFARILAG